MNFLTRLKKRHPRILSITGRVAVAVFSVLMLYLTLRKTGSDVLGDLLQADYLPVAGGIVLYGIIQIIGAWRWKMLLDVQGIDLSFAAVLKLTLIGCFFVLLIPGAASGDILKLAYAGKHCPGRVPSITLTIVLDRILGLSGLFLVAFLVTVFHFPMLLSVFEEHVQLRWALFAVNAGFFGSVLLYVLYRLRIRYQDGHTMQEPGKFEKSLPRLIYAPLHQFFQGLDLYRSCQKVLFFHLGLSACIHFFSGCIFYMLGKAFHETVMTFQQYQITTQISNATGILPVTPGGLGLRDYTATAFFEIFNMTPAEISGSIALSYSFCMLFWALAGALILVFSPNLRHYAKS